MFPETNRDRMESYQHKLAKTSLKKIISYPSSKSFLSHKSTIYKYLPSWFFPKKNHMISTSNKGPVASPWHPHGIPTSLSCGYLATANWLDISKHFNASPLGSFTVEKFIAMWMNKLSILGYWVEYWVFIDVFLQFILSYWKSSFSKLDQKVENWSSSMNGPHRAAQWITRGGMIHAGQVAISGFLSIYDVGLGLFMTS